jgi:FAD/FMN-containing dehydrogenase
MASPALTGVEPEVASTLVNDIHSQLNATRVDAVVRPRDVSEMAAAVAHARNEGKSVSIAGGRHAMGGQQFGEASVLIDTRALDRVLAFDTERGLVTVEAGILWPALLEYLERVQRDSCGVPEDPSPVNNPRDPRPVNDLRDLRPVNNPRDPRPVNDPRDLRPVSDPRDPRPVNDPRDPRPVSDPRDPRPVNNPRDPRPVNNLPHPRWGIVQKQTGADRLSLGGALACNAHGRGLALKPIVDQVESFDLLDPTGATRTCSRREHPDLFRLAIGGYGLFGIITRVQLRLRPRVKVERVVTRGETADIMERFERRIGDGYLYGDFQFATDDTRDSFLRRGIFSCYRPVAPATPLTENPTRFHPDDWARLTRYSHTNKRLAFDFYTSRYLQTSGQIYWSDSQLSAAYVDNYHADLDRATGARVKGSEMITEIYVERAKLAAFMEDAREALRAHRANVIYGTVRLIEKDDETFLAWARDRYACIIFNLHVDHTPAEIARATDAFRALIDLGIRHGGSYYLTYHRWARKDQVERCYPQLPEFLTRKRQFDPSEVFQSNWYRHYRNMFGKC